MTTGNRVNRSRYGVGVLIRSQGVAALQHDKD